MNKSKILLECNLFNPLRVRFNDAQICGLLMVMNMCSFVKSVNCLCCHRTNNDVLDAMLGRLCYRETTTDVVVSGARGHPTCPRTQ